MTKLNSSADSDNAADLEEKCRTKKRKTREREVWDEGCMDIKPRTKKTLRIGEREQQGDRDKVHSKKGWKVG